MSLSLSNNGKINVKDKSNKSNKENNQEASNSNNQISLKREQLKEIRDQLFTIQKQEDKTLQDHS